MSYRLKTVLEEALGETEATCFCFLAMLKVVLGFLLYWLPWLPGP